MYGLHLHIISMLVVVYKSIDITTNLEIITKVQNKQYINMVLLVFVAYSRNGNRGDATLLQPSKICGMEHVVRRPFI